MASESGKGFRRLAPFFANLSRVALCGCLLLGGAGDAAAGSLYNVAKVSVDVTAKDAVVARDKGMAEAETRAWRTLLDRLVPLHARSSLPAFSHDEIQGFVAGIAIGEERTAGNRYLATLDVRFDPVPVRRFLAARSIPFQEDQASSISLLPVMLEGDVVPPEGETAWRDAWARLDLANGVAPATLVGVREDLDSRTVRDLLAGDESAYAELRSTYGYGGLVVAVGDTTDGFFRTRLAGEDAAGTINVVETRALDPNDRQRTLDDAAEAALATLETRWRRRLDTGSGEAAQDVGTRGALFPEGGSGEPDAPLGHVDAVIEFFNVRDWQRIRFGLRSAAGIEDVSVETPSDRSAQVSFDFDGPVERLQAVLAQNGIALYERDGTFVLRAR